MLVHLQRTELRSDIDSVRGDIPLPSPLTFGLHLLPSLRKVHTSAAAQQHLSLAVLPQLTDLAIDELCSRHAPLVIPCQNSLRKLELTFAGEDVFLPWNFITETPRLHQLTELTVSHCPILLNHTLVLNALTSLAHLHLFGCECAESFLALASDNLVELTVQPIASKHLADFLLTTRSTLRTLSCLVEGDREFDAELIEGITVHGDTLKELMLDGKCFGGYMTLPIRRWRRLAMAISGLQKLSIRPDQAPYSNGTRYFEVSRCHLPFSDHD